ncbi:MAG: DUF1614 domain-containing protein [Chloroflexi bacterium]|nr:DUF1614 domain-containing protein [Chloroflexota bacterium]
MRLKWQSTAEKLSISRNSWLLIGIVTTFVILSVIANSRTTSLVDDLYSQAVQIFCSPEPDQVVSFPLSVRGAVLPVMMSLFLAAIWLRDKHSVAALVLSTLTICLIAYHSSEMITGGGVLTKGLLLGTVSGIVAVITVNFSLAVKSIADRDNFDLDIRLLTANLRKSLAVGYFSGVFGTLAGADILRSCAFLDEAASLTIGGAGAWDAIYLSGAFSVVVTGTLWLVVCLIATYEDEFHDTFDPGLPRNGQS